MTYFTYFTKFFSPSSAGDFACSAGKLEIGSESWSLQPKAGDWASMISFIISLFNEPSLFSSVQL